MSIFLHSCHREIMEISMDGQDEYLDEHDITIDHNFHEYLDLEHDITTNEHDITIEHNLHGPGA